MFWGSFQEPAQLAQLAASPLPSRRTLPLSTVGRRVGATPGRSRRCGTNESSILTDDSNVGGANDPTAFQVSGIAQVPTLSPHSLAVLALLGLAAPRAAV